MGKPASTAAQQIVEAASAPADVSPPLPDGAPPSCCVKAKRKRG
jgi:hypothetical protein